MSFLRWRGVLNRDYKNWMQAQTDALVTAVDHAVREQTGKPIVPLSTWRADKEQLARKRQEQTGIEKGLIGAWSCLESCWSYRAHYCAEKGYPQLRRYTTQCKHLSYYWTLWQSEWATDLIMDKPAALTATMASLLRHAWITCSASIVAHRQNRPPHPRSCVLCARASPTFPCVLKSPKMLCDSPWGAGRTEKQISARISRHLRLLRDHGIIRKITNRHRYHLTDKGRQLTTALNAMLAASTEQLLDLAA